MHVAAVANCETADCFVNSAAPGAAPPKSFTCFLWPETLQARTRAAGARRSAVRLVRGRSRLFHRGCTTAFGRGACGDAAGQASDSRRGRATGCAQVRARFDDTRRTEEGLRRAVGGPHLVKVCRRLCQRSGTCIAQGNLPKYLYSLETLLREALQQAGPLLLQQQDLLASARR